MQVILFAIFAQSLFYLIEKQKLVVSKHWTVGEA